jgi:hypothetical protein
MFWFSSGNVFSHCVSNGNGNNHGRPESQLGINS